VKRVLRGAGNESITWKNGSRIDVLASTEAAGHGRDIDLGVIDEAMADYDDRREQALLPGMATRESPQLWVISNAGTQASTYLLRKVRDGRAAVESDPGYGIAYFEWSAPETADRDDPEVWRRTHPALGHKIEIDTIRQDRMTMADDEFARAYLNIWTQSDQRVIPADAWDRICDPAAIVAPIKAFGVDATPDRSSAAICVSYGRTVELVEVREGVRWLVERLDALVAKHGGVVAVDTMGPAGFLAELGSLPTVPYTTRKYVAAVSQIYDRILDGDMAVRTHPLLDVAVDVATRRTIGDAWGWARKSLDGSVAPLVAATLALDAATQVADEPEPVDPLSQIF